MIGRVKNENLKEVKNDKFKQKKRKIYELMKKGGVKKKKKKKSVLKLESLFILLLFHYYFSFTFQRCFFKPEVMLP